MTKKKLVAGLFSGSWKTTVMGIAGLLVSIGALGKCLIDQIDGNADTVPEWENAFTACGAALAALGLTFARDDKVTSEEAGAK